jgi:folate-binding protein YgfZ
VTEARILQEYRAAKTSAAVVDIGSYGKILFRGPDSADFLQGLLTNDISKLSVNQGLPASLLTHKGKLTAHFWLCRRGEGEFLAFHPPQVTARLTGGLAKYLLLSDTKLEDVSAAWSAYLLLGPRAAGVLQSLVALKLLSGPESDGGFAFSYPVFQSDGLVLCVPSARAAGFHNAMMESGKAFGLETIGQETSEILRVEAGVPLIGVDTDDDTYPVEVNLEESISYDKGCYLGQETIARLKTYGRVNRRLSALRLSRRIPAGTELLHENELVGKITSVAESPALGCFLGMAKVGHPHAEPGVTLTFGTGDGTAEVVPFPSRPGGK